MSFKFRFQLTNS